MTEVYAPIINPEMTIEDALSQVCRVSLAENKLVRGARQTSKALLKNKAKVVLLANDMPKDYLTIITFLAKNSNVPVIKIDDSKALGELVGLKKVNIHNNFKIGKCGCACILDFVRNTEGRIMVEQMLRQH
ncbi:40S ribosomal protein S12 [Dictyocoela roeselum]|nr:40S ribosomal protein S12 [Dictyocoela roeselum]